MIIIAFVVVITISGDGRQTELAILLPVFLPGLLVFGMSAIGWALAASDARTNPHLSTEERAVWISRLSSNPYATAWYWLRVVRGRAP